MPKKKKKDEQDYVYAKLAVLLKFTGSDSFILVGTKLQSIEKITSSQLENLIQMMKDREKEYEE